MEKVILTGMRFRKPAEDKNKNRVQPSMGFSVKLFDMGLLNELKSYRLTLEEEEIHGVVIGTNRVQGEREDEK